MKCPACGAGIETGAGSCFKCGRALGILTEGTLVASRYEIRSPIGRGGMGVVYKAHDRMLDEDVALKVLRAEYALDPDMARRFRHEIKLARKVSHRNVCRIHEYGYSGSVHYISMEYVEGVDVKRTLRKQGALPGDKAFDVSLQAASGLRAIHEAGIIHRDLKSQNIMRDARGEVRLLDFGIAKQGDQRTGELTVTGQILGTPEYMSPEQCRGEPIDERSDIYSLGVVMFELFTGQVPFKGDTPIATLFKHIQQPPPLPEFAAVIPETATPVLAKALAKDREARYASAADLVRALKTAWEDWRASGAAQAQTGAVATPPPPAEPTPPPQPKPEAPGIERRQWTRLDIFVNFTLTRLGPDGKVLQEERTIADNISRGGARVLTAMPIKPRDVVGVREVGGDFESRAQVRGVSVGRDRITRLHLKFLDRPAPNRMIGRDPRASDSGRWRPSDLTD